MTVLLLADHDNSHLGDSTTRALTAALAIAPEVDLLILGHDCTAACEEAASLDGVRRVRVGDDPRFKTPLAEDIAAAVLPLMEDYDSLVTPATSLGKNAAPRIAALLDVPQISEIISVEAADVFIRPIYAGNALQKIRTRASKQVITIRATAFNATESGDATAAIETISLPPVGDLSHYVSARISQSERPELTSAGIVISGGRGMKSGENFALIETIADRLGAAVGASRAAVDAGFISNDHQVGQTGKVVAPELYIAVGISGAIQHLAGMKDSRVIVAINKDAEAPIFQVADYGLVADLFSALPELDAALASALADH